MTAGDRQTSSDPTIDQSVAQGRLVIVYFDGFCNLCNGFINFLVSRDRHRRLRFAPLQGVTAQVHVPSLTKGATGDVPDSVVVVDRGRIMLRSEAALHVLIQIGGVWAIIGRLGRVCPEPLRNGVYRWFAANRYRWFGRRDSCRTPSPEERELFLP